MYARLQGFHRGPGEGVGSDAPPPPRTCRGEGQRGPALPLLSFRFSTNSVDFWPTDPRIFQNVVPLKPPSMPESCERRCPPPPAFEMRPFRLSETTKICGGQSIVNFCEGYFHITLLFKGIYKSSDCQG